MTGAEDRLHVLGRAGEDDELGNSSVPGESVALVHAELLRLGYDVRFAERRPQLGDEGGGQAHAVESRAEPHLHETCTNPPLDDDTRVVI
jgi:hypothetical protein